GPAGRVAQHEEEGSGGEAGQQGPGVAAEEDAGAGGRARLPDPEVGKAIPHGVSDVGANEGLWPSATTPTPRLSPWPPSAAGGTRWGGGGGGGGGAGSRGGGRL